MTRVLFVDGEPNIRRLCLEELEEEGYEVQVAGTAGEVARLIDSFQPEVVILDVWLPDMSGLEAGRIIKGTSRKTQVIFHSFGPAPDKLDDWGGDAFVEKSFDLSELKHTMSILADLKEAWLDQPKELAPNAKPYPGRGTNRPGASS